MVTKKEKLQNTPCRSFIYARAAMRRKRTMSRTMPRNNIHSGIPSIPKSLEDFGLLDKPKVNPDREARPEA